MLAPTDREGSFPAPVRLTDPPVGSTAAPVVAGNRADVRLVGSPPRGPPMAGVPVPVVRAGFGIGASLTVVAETDCLTVVVTWLTSGTTAPVMPGTTGITDAVRCIGAPVTDGTGTALASDDVELTSDDVERPGGGTVRPARGPGPSM